MEDIYENIPMGIYWLDIYHRNYDNELSSLVCNFVCNKKIKTYIFIIIL